MSWMSTYSVWELHEICDDHRERMKNSIGSLKDHQERLAEKEEWRLSCEEIHEKNAKNFKCELRDYAVNNLELAKILNVNRVRFLEMFHGVPPRKSRRWQRIQAGCRNEDQRKEHTAHLQFGQGSSCQCHACDRSDPAE